MKTIERVAYFAFNKDQVYTRLTTDRGRVVEFAVVYYTIVDGRAVRSSDSTANTATHTSTYSM